MTEYDDDALVRALQSSGTTTELQDEERYLAMFREAQPAGPVRSLPRRTIGRLGAGGTAVVVTVALTSGVAAAYTGHLPDPVQRLAHTVIGAPAPDHESAQHHGAGPRPGGAVVPRHSGPTTTTPSPQPTSSASGSPTPESTAGAAPATSGRSAHPTGGPSGSPTPGTVGTPAAGAVPAALTLSAAAHRSGVGAGVTFTGVLTDADGGVVADHPVVLQARGRQHWRPVATGTTDATGTVSVTTPPLDRTSLFRWHTDHRVHSPRWLVRLVPALTASVDTGGATSQVSATASGARPGDRVRLLKRTRHGPVAVGRGRLDAAGSVGISVATPRHRTAYVVLLPRTPRHTAAHARVVVVPPAPARLTIGAATHRVGYGSTVVIGGVVSSADGAGLPGRTVVLQRRGPRRWLAVGRATTDASGSVSITTPAVTHTGGYRLRTARVHSAPWRVVEVPALTADGARDGTSVVVTARAQGAHGGDRVVLLRKRPGGGLVHLARTSLGADGTASFTVPARRARTTYVVRLVATPKHGLAVARTVVPRAG